MRTTFWISLLSTALLAGSACKRNTEDKNMDRAASSAQKVQENVNENAKDVHEQQKDVTKAQNELDKQQQQLSQSEAELAQARDRFVAAARDRLAQLDQRIHDLGMQTDTKSKETVAAVKAERDVIAQKIESVKTIGTTAPMANQPTASKSFDDAKKDLDDAFAKAEKDVNDAMK